MKIFDKTYDGLVQSLDLYYRRHSVLSSNIANSETPKYRARELNFAGVLEKTVGMQNRELQTSDPRHFSTANTAPGPFITFDNNGEIGADGNNVDLDLAVGKISANSEVYQQSITYLQAKLRVLRQAMGRGGV